MASKTVTQNTAYLNTPKTFIANFRHILFVQLSSVRKYHENAYFCIIFKAKTLQNPEVKRSTPPRGKHRQTSRKKMFVNKYKITCFRQIGECVIRREPVNTSFLAKNENVPVQIQNVVDFAGGDQVLFGANFFLRRVQQQNQFVVAP